MAFYLYIFTDNHRSTFSIGVCKTINELVSVKKTAATLFDMMVTTHRLVYLKSFDDFDLAQSQLNILSQMPKILIEKWVRRENSNWTDLWYQLSEDMSWFSTSYYVSDRPLAV